MEPRDMVVHLLDPCVLGVERDGKNLAFIVHPSNPWCFKGRESGETEPRDRVIHLLDPCGLGVRQDGKTSIVVPGARGRMR
jgi:hypothetical protein